jgi:cytochrome P450
MARWSKAAQQDIFHNLLNNPAMHAACVQAGAELRAYLTGLFAERRAASNLATSGDTVSRLIRTVFPREIGWDDERLISNVMGLLIGAVETSSAAIAQALDQLLARPDALAAAQAAALRGDDKTFDAYVWEALRFFPVNPFVVRGVVSDYVLAASTPRAATIPAGTLALVGTRSAMQDGDVLPDPQTIKLDRPAWAYMHFGSGPHVCLGKYVGMMLVPAVLKQLLRLPKLRRADGPAGQLDFQGGDFPESLTVAFG